MSFINSYIEAFAKDNFNPNNKVHKARFARIQQNQALQAIHFLDEFLAIEEGKELETTRIGYWPLNKKHCSWRTKAYLVIVPANC
ncbi:hypothetical protein [Legionella londiniensis]|uniref:Uncharacterized protein n=1 Tax=Legionella londiniensis TaxID=45068 RepID=A0A0W0VM32_9GAMM|nr:hypothetical protein [Legionella londiniensis]KTD21178.1 hypothetical protein Llon_1276 [Legionella londiniensis]STX93202.1 Uncharacterised protein [Legionella londiniensis]